VSGTLVEVIGYAGSALVILSLLQKSILRLRTIGLAASSTFLVYSVSIGAYPIAVVNVVAAVIHLYYLRKLLRRKNEVFTLLQMRPESRYLQRFLEFYADDIAVSMHPDFAYDPAPDIAVFFLLRDMVPAGLVVARLYGDSSIEILPDYVIPNTATSSWPAGCTRRSPGSSTRRIADAPGPGSQHPNRRPTSPR
jgi:hypothetical protein